MTRLPAVLAAATLLTLLAACGPGSPAPTPTDTAAADPSGEPTAEPAAAVADRPEPRFGEGCDALVPDALLTAIFPFTVEPHDLLATEYAAWPDIPRHGAVAQVGGLLCEWSNGEPYSSATGASEFHGIQLAVLPEAADGWDTLLGMYGYGPEGEVYCNPSGPICTFDVYSAGYWFAAEISAPVSAGTPAAVEALADHLLTQVAGFGALEPLWEPADLVRLPHDCAVVLPASVVDAIHGPGHTLYETDGGGGWSLWAEAMTRNAGFGCGWFDETRGIAVEWQNGGAWLAEHLGVTTNGVDIDIPALGSDGVARLTCFVGGECRADLVVHGTWISATVSNSADPEAGVRLFATHLAGLMTD